VWHAGTGLMGSFLFVGAPFGPFFRALTADIEKRGGTVWRVVTEGGEFLETPRRCRILFRGGNWPAFVRQAMIRRRIDAVVTFNDTLERNRTALDVAASLGLHSFVLENGYLRPFWVTLERDGVNGFSRLPRDPAVYLDPRYRNRKPLAHQPFAARLRPHVTNTARHFAAAIAMWPVLGFDTRYYGDSIYRQALGYVGEACWRATHSEADKLRAVATLVSEGRKIFLCLLQKPGDGQLLVHSRHRGNEAFLEEVLSSFAAHAPPDAALVVKQHPLDYAIERSAEKVDALIARHGLSGRVIYLRKTSIDKITPFAFAVLTINSTAGLATIVLEKPVICLGRSFYSIDGLTFQGPLHAFWTEARPPDPELTRGFVAFLMATSQINGGFHTRTARALLAPRLADRLIEGVAVEVPPRLAITTAASYAERHRAPSPRPKLAAPRL
jgi:capsular polysaccharide export protein